jgi:hypothetical protein
MKHPRFDLDSLDILITSLMSFEPNSLQTFSAIVIAVYYVHSFYIIRADVIVKKDTEKY